MGKLAEMSVQKLVKSANPRELLPNDPTEPRPKTCPKCNGRRIKAVEPVTDSGLAVWRCAGCRAIGYGQRVVGSPTSGGETGAVPTDGAYRKNLLK